MSRKALFILSTILVSIISYGQVTLVAIPDDKDLKVSERFTVTFVLEINGDEYIQESPLKLPDLSKFNIIGSAANQNTYVDARKNIVVNQIVYQFALEPKNSGKNKIGSALVQVNGKMYKTEPFDVFVKDKEKITSNDELTSNNDLYLNLEIKEKDVYANQPTVAVLRAYSKDFDNFRKVGDISFPKQNDIDFQPVSYKKSDIEPAVKGDYASQVIAVFMVFPEKSGKVEVEPVSALVKNKEIKILSNKVNLNVKKLPEGSPENFKNAVGKFKLDVLKDTEDDKVELYKPINIVVKMSGEGNFENMVFPKIVSTNFYKVFPPKIVKNLVPGNDGLKGDISANYVIVPYKSGNISIATEQFSYFNPESKKYVNVGSKYLSVNVLSQEQFAADKSTIEKVNDYTSSVLETVNVPILKNEQKVVKKGKLDWNIILINILVFLSAVSLLFYLRKYKKNKKKANFNSRQKPIETVSEVEDKIRAMQKFSVNDYLQYLSHLTQERNFSKFFSTYEEMVKDYDNQIFKSENKTLGKYIEEHFGIEVFTEYQELEHKINLEKYAPIHAEDTLERLYTDIFRLYSKISK